MVVGFNVYNSTTQGSDKKGRSYIKGFLIMVLGFHGFRLLGFRVGSGRLEVEVSSRFRILVSQGFGIQAARFWVPGSRFCDFTI